MGRASSQWYLCNVRRRTSGFRQTLKRSLDFPGTNDGDIHEVEVADVARCDRQDIALCYSCNEGIAEVERSAHAAGLRSETGGTLRRRPVQRQMQSAYVETILVSRACKWSRRRPCGSNCTPYSNSCTTNDGSQRSSCSAKNAITPGCGASRVNSESTFVSRRKPLTQCLPERTEFPVGNRGRVGFRGLRLAGRSLSATAPAACVGMTSGTRCWRARRHRDCGCRYAVGPSDSASRRISESRALASATVQTRWVSDPFTCKTP